MASNQIEILSSVRDGNKITSVAVLNAELPDGDTRKVTKTYIYLIPDRDPAQTTLQYIQSTATWTKQHITIGTPASPHATQISELIMLAKADAMQLMPPAPTVTTFNITGVRY